jgi:hypothetical protein
VRSPVPLEVRPCERIVAWQHSEPASRPALDVLADPLESGAMIGGMEVRMMAVLAIERAGIAATEVGTKARAMGLLQSSAAKSGWEPEARRRAQEGAARIQNSLER